MRASSLCVSPKLPPPSPLTLPAPLPLHHYITTQGSDLLQAHLASADAASASSSDSRDTDAGAAECTRRRAEAVHHLLDASMGAVRSLLGEGPAGDMTCERGGNAGALLGQGQGPDAVPGLLAAVWGCHGWLAQHDSHTARVSRQLSVAAAASEDAATIAASAISGFNEGEAGREGEGEGERERMWRASLGLGAQLCCLDAGGGTVTATVVGVNKLVQEVSLEYTSLAPTAHAEAGAGATVCITLPLASRRLQPLQSASAEERRPSGHKHGSDEVSDATIATAGQVTDYYRNYLAQQRQVPHNSVHAAGGLDGSIGEDVSEGEEAGDEGDDTLTRSRSNSDLSTSSSVSIGSPLGMGVAGHSLHPLSLSSRGGAESTGAGGAGAGAGASAEEERTRMAARLRAADKSLLCHFIRYSQCCERALFGDSAHSGSDSNSIPAVRLALLALVEAQVNLELCRGARVCASLFMYVRLYLSILPSLLLTPQSPSRHTASESSRKSLEGPALAAFFRAAVALLSLTDAAGAAYGGPKGSGGVGGVGAGNYSHYDSRKKDDRGGGGGRGGRSRYVTCSVG